MKFRQFYLLRSSEWLEEKMNITMMTDDIETYRKSHMTEEFFEIDLELTRLLNAEFEIRIARVPGKIALHECE